MGIVGWLFPKRCVGCESEGKYLCEQCEENIWAIGQSLRYEGVIRKIIKEIKYRGTYTMVKELIDVWERVTGYKPDLDGREVITSVPMWESKRRSRGFNQAELIAREIAKRWKVEYRELLMRTKETKPMYGLTKKERSENVRGAFKLLDRSRIEVKTHIFLVDDVWTTGSTMKECQKVLKQITSKPIWLITIAR